MRISDWSSDVCSSDLLALDHRPDWRDTDSARDENRMRRAFLERKIVRRRGDRQPVADPHLLMHELRSAAAAPVEVDRNHIAIGLPLRIDQRIASHQAIDETDDDVRAGRERGQCAALGRSEEHTSELQSLMRSSYAVLCLKTT